MRLFQNPSKLQNQSLLYLLALSLWALFQIVRLKEPRFQKALKNFNATYQLRSGEATLKLVFVNEKIRIVPGRTETPDFELIFLDIPGTIQHLKDYPGDVIGLLFENKIDKKGNTYFLSKLGYLLGLCERYVREQLEHYPALSSFLAIDDD
ncbi:hypothetical protein WDW89_16220 [Deltaproteobacteria bacterium TL4]